MFFVQYYLDCLSQASYLIGDETAGQAVVVDPRRDVADYLTDAAAHGLTIVGSINTHFHADFLSGHLELARETGAWIGYGSAAQAQFPIRRLDDGERISLGDLSLEVMETPGHTPESISVLVHEHRDDHVAYGVLTGDALLLGDVGRPDLLASAGVAPGQLGRMLYHSVQHRLMGLPDAVRVFPAHGAGSACGRNLSQERQSTIGEQRRVNRACRPMTEQEFVALVTEGQPTVPAYFAYDALLNRQLRAVRDTDTVVPGLSADAVEAVLAQGAVLHDAREPQDFAAGHVRGSINVPSKGRMAETVGAVLTPERPLVVIAPEGQEQEVAMRLARIGFDNVVGHVDEPELLLGRQDELVRARRLSASEAEAALASAEVQLVDVRNAGEVAGGMVPVPGTSAGRTASPLRGAGARQAGPALLRQRVAQQRRRERAASRRLLRRVGHPRWLRSLGAPAPTGIMTTRSPVCPRIRPRAHRRCVGGVPVEPEHGEAGDRAVNQALVPTHDAERAPGERLRERVGCQHQRGLTLHRSAYAERRERVQAGDAGREAGGVAARVPAVVRLDLGKQLAGLGAVTADQGEPQQGRGHDGVPHRSDATSLPFQLAGAGDVAQALGCDCAHEQRAGVSQTWRARVRRDRVPYPLLEVADGRPVAEQLLDFDQEGHAMEPVVRGEGPGEPVVQLRGGARLVEPARGDAGRGDRLGDEGTQVRVGDPIKELQPARTPTPALFIVPVSHRHHSTRVPGVDEQLGVVEVLGDGRRLIGRTGIVQIAKRLGDERLCPRPAPRSRQRQAGPDPGVKAFERRGAHPLPARTKPSTASSA